MTFWMKPIIMTIELKCLKLGNIERNEK